MKKKIGQKKKGVVIKPRFQTPIKTALLLEIPLLDRAKLVASGPSSDACKATETSACVPTSCTVSMGGGGSLLRQRFTITQVTLRRKVIGMEGLIKDSRGLTTPREMTKSLH